MFSSSLVLITGDGYSLEEARKKREEDMLLAAADAKKQGVRAYVQELRAYAPARLCNLGCWCQTCQADMNDHRTIRCHDAPLR